MYKCILWIPCMYYVYIYLINTLYVLCTDLFHEYLYVLCTYVLNKYSVYTMYICISWIPCMYYVHMHLIKTLHVLCIIVFYEYFVHISWINCEFFVLWQLWEIFIWRLNLLLLISKRERNYNPFMWEHIIIFVSVCVLSFYLVFNMMF